MGRIYIVGLVLLLIGLVGCRTHDMPLNMLDINSVEPVKIVEIRVKCISRPNPDGSINVHAEFNNQEIILDGFAPNGKKYKPGDPVEIKRGRRYIVALYGPEKTYFKGSISHDCNGKMKKFKSFDRYQCLNLYGDRFYPVSEELLYLDDLDLKPLE